MESSQLPQSQWANVLRCHAQFGKSFEDRIRLLYDKTGQTQIPLELRSALADHIEKEDWNNIAEDAAVDHFEDLTRLLQAKSGSGDLVATLKWKDYLDHMNDIFKDKPRHYITQVKTGLTMEKMIIESCTNQGESLRHGAHADDEPSMEPEDIKYQLRDVHTNLEQLRENVERTNTCTLQLLNGQEYIEKIKRIDASLTSNPNDPNKNGWLNQKAGYQKSYRALQNAFVHSKTEAEQKQAQLCASIKTLFTKLQDSANYYQSSYRLSVAKLQPGNEAFVSTLNKLCTQAFELFLKSIAQIDTLLEIYRSATNRADFMKNANDNRQALFDAFGECLKSTIIVEMSKQILKVTTERSPHFRADLKILGGSKLGFDTGTGGKVIANVYKSEAIEKLRQGNDAKPFCKLTNGEKKIDVTNLDCVARFDKLKLESVRDRNQALRGSREELVCEQRYQIVFNLEFQIKDQKFKLMPESFVFSIISNPSQEIAAKGNLLWQAAFPNENEVTWSRVSQLLKNLFWIETGRSLDKSQLDYLVRRLFSSSHQKLDDYAGKDYSNEMVSYDLFVKKPMWERRKSFSFWKWISCCINTIAKEKGPAHKEWIKPGVIHGFMARDDAARLLKSAHPGTAIVRFSESTIDNECGGANPYAALNVGFRYYNHERDIDDVYFTMEALNPRESDNYRLKGRGLGAILTNYYAKGDQNRLITYIYPDMPITQAFEDCIPPVTTAPEDIDMSGPYCKSAHAIHLERGAGHFAALARHDQHGVGIVPQPSSPHSEYMQSPDPGMVNSPLSANLMADDSTPWPTEFIDLNTTNGGSVPHVNGQETISAADLEMLTLQNLNMFPNSNEQMPTNMQI